MSDSASDLEPSDPEPSDFETSLSASDAEVEVTGSALADVGAGGDESAGSSSPALVSASASASHVPVVAVGAPDHGWGAFVMECLGLAGDEYTDEAAALVKEMQKSAGLDETGVVSDMTWALVLPELAKSRARGTVTVFLRKLIGLRGGRGWDERVDIALDVLGIAVGDEPVLDRDAWTALLAVVCDEGES